ncbi:MAG: peptidoglycan-binding protein [Terrisporobacter othiniensis]|uniref:peptidoglycan recognition protein family protein n=1 Tax=Terrisporobacter othiniensis TaxID=1577792 RepID=UPI002900CEDC|nr:peptidoglycan-binding protein [Terrisporobacter othiniensis]MDU2200113.1 peptidoglycan-binding protein [Terrisporobacter othiniensis]
MSEKRNGFIRFDNIDEFETYIKNLKIRRKINGLQVHHMALPNYACFYKGKGVTEDELVRTINLDYYGKSKGWSCIAQHFNIFPNGKITTGRDINKTPVGITGWNANKICIEIYGDFDKNKDVMKVEQKEAVIAVYAILCEKLNLTPSTSTIRAHAWFTSGGTYLGDYYKGKSRKTCPGTNFMGFGNSRKAFVNNFYPLIKDYMSNKDSSKKESKEEVKEENKEKYIVRYLQSTLNKVYKCNLVVDGIYGKATKDVVKKHYLKMGNKGEHVMWLQKALINRGYNIEADGSFGSKTKAAVMSYQKSRGLKVDGYVGVDTHSAIVDD